MGTLLDIQRWRNFRIATHDGSLHVTFGWSAQWGYCEINPRYWRRRLFMRHLWCFERSDSSWWIETPFWFIRLPRGK